MAEAKAKDCERNGPIASAAPGAIAPGAQNGSAARAQLWVLSAGRNAAAAAFGCTDYSTRAYSYLHARVAGLNELAWGALFFLLAALIGVVKSRLRVAWSRRKVE